MRRLPAATRRRSHQSSHARHRRALTPVDRTPTELATSSRTGIHVLRTNRALADLVSPQPINTNTHTHTTQCTHPFNGPFSGTTQVSRYQKGKTNLDFTEARDSDWQWHQLGHMQVCTLLQTLNHTSTPHHSVFTGRMPFLPPNQQRQSTEGNAKHSGNG